MGTRQIGDIVTEGVSEKYNKLLTLGVNQLEMELASAISQGSAEGILRATHSHSHSEAREVIEAHSYVRKVLPWGDDSTYIGRINKYPISEETRKVVKEFYKSHPELA